MRGCWRGRSSWTRAKGQAKASSRGQGRDIMPGLMAIAMVDGGEDEWQDEDEEGG
jgi:hypothetical protein